MRRNTFHVSQNPDLNKSIFSLTLIGWGWGLRIYVPWLGSRWANFNRKSAVSSLREKTFLQSCLQSSEQKGLAGFGHLSCTEFPGHWNLSRPGYSNPVAVTQTSQLRVYCPESGIRRYLDILIFLYIYNIYII